MIIIAVLSVLLLFYSTRKYFGILAAYILFILIISNNYIQNQLSRAMSESPLLLFIILVIILLFVAARFLISNNKPVLENKKKLIIQTLLILFTGIMIGITGGIKLNGFALLGVGIILFTLLLFFSTYLKTFTIKLKILLLTCTIVILILASFSTFISYNPFLYNNTVERTAAIFKWRIHEMKIQTSKSESADLTRINLSERIIVVTNNVFNKYSTISFKGAFILNLTLFLFGFILALKNSLQFLNGSKGNLAHLILIISSIVVAGPSLLTPLNWDRYFYLPVIFSTIFISIGISQILRFIYVKYVLQQFTTRLHAHS